MGRQPPNAPGHPVKIRRKVLASGTIAAIAIGAAAAVALSPMTAARSDLAEIVSNGLPVQGQIVTLRTTLANWQFFVEAQFDGIAPGVVPNPTLLAKGAQLATGQTAQEVALARSLRKVGFTSDARDLDRVMGTFNAAIEKLTPIASGLPVTPANRITLIAGERAAYQRVWNTSAQVVAHVTQDITASEIREAAVHVDLGRTLFLLAAALDVLLVLLASIVFGIRGGRQERARARTALRREYEGRLQKALEMTKTESDVYGIVGRSLHDSLPHQKVEMLIADSSHSHFRRALTSDGDFEGCGVISPLDCPAAAGGQDLVFPSSRAIDACPYLKGRPSGECSAACLPLSVAGGAIGVTHVIGRDGSPPAEGDIETVTFTSGRGSERIAMIRAFETSENQAHTDPLTGLLNRRSLEMQVRELRAEHVSYALAYGDLDLFKSLNDTHGHEMGDQALRLFSRVLRDSVRPNDIVARYGGEEFVIVLPDCGTEVATTVLERVRSRLAIALSPGRVPSFTVTFGVASTGHASEFEEVVQIADRALLEAKLAGRDRILVAEIPVATGS